MRAYQFPQKTWNGLAPFMALRFTIAFARRKSVWGKGEKSDKGLPVNLSSLSTEVRLELTFPK